MNFLNQMVLQELNNFNVFSFPQSNYVIMMLFRMKQCSFIPLLQSSTLASLQLDSPNLRNDTQSKSFFFNLQFDASVNAPSLASKGGLLTPHCRRRSHVAQKFYYFYKLQNFKTITSLLPTLENHKFCLCLYAYMYIHIYVCMYCALKSKLAYTQMVDSQIQKTYMKIIFSF